MQIANLSAQPRRRPPRLGGLAAPARRLRVVVDSASNVQRARLVAELEPLLVAGPFELSNDDGPDVAQPLVRISTDGELGEELELRAETKGSAAASTLVFELVQSLAHAAFGVHVTFSGNSPQRRHAASRRNRR